MSGPWDNYRSSGPWARYSTGETSGGDRRVLGRTRDGGEIYELPDGTRGYAGENLATTDPDTVARLAEGMTPQDAFQSGLRNQMIDQNPVAARGAVALRGVPFVGQYADEAIGATFGDQAMDATRFLQSSMDQERPGASLGYGIAGGVAGSLPLAPFLGGLGAAMPAGVGAQMLAGAGIGAGLGATEGAISGYGAGNDGDRMAKAGEFGLLGGLMGGAVGGLLPGVAAAGRGAYNALSDRFSSAQRQIPGLSRQASDQVLMRAQGDNIGPQTTLTRAESMPAEAGPGMRALLDQAVNTSPEGGGVALRNIGARVQAASPRLTAAFDDAMGGPEGAAALSNAIRAARKPGINQAYRQAYDTPIDYTSEAGRNIEALIDRLPPRQVQRAVDMATDRMVYDGAPNPQIIARIGDDGKVAFDQLPNVMQMDYIKRAFDQIARDGADPITGRMTSEGAFASRIARDIREALGEAVPTYRQALREASDEFALQDATRLGGDLLRRQTTREQVAEWASSAAPLERQAAAAGLRSEIDEIMANAQRAISSGDMDITEIRSILRPLSSRANSQKVEAVLGEQAASRVFDAAEEMADALLLQQRVAVGSGTAPRTAGDQMLRESMATEPGQIARDAASGRLLSSGQNVLQRAFANTGVDQAARRAEVYREIADFLTSAQGPQAAGRVGLMSDALQQQAIQQGGANRAGALSAFGFGLPAYQAGTQMTRQ